jgi:hypothetical protein
LSYRLGVHLGVLPLWLIGFLIVFPLTWLALNEVAWKAGYGGPLTDRPSAAVHHRVMGTIQDFENAGDDIGYYEGHLQGFPDATTEDRAEWQRELDAARHQQRLILIKSALVGLLAYLPVGLILDRWLMGGRSADALVMV